MPFVANLHCTQLICTTVIGVLFISCGARRPRQAAQARLMRPGQCNSFANMIAGGGES